MGKTRAGTRMLVVVFAAVVALAACGGPGSSADEGGAGSAADRGSNPGIACNAVLEIHEMSKAAVDETDLAVRNDPRTYEYLQERIDSRLASIKRNGPRRVAEAIDTAQSRSDEDSVVIAEQQAYKKATKTIDAWIETECGLAISLDGL